MPTKTTDKAEYLQMLALLLGQGGRDELMQQVRKLAFANKMKVFDNELFYLALVYHIIIFVMRRSRANGVNPEIKDGFSANPG